MSAAELSPFVDGELRPALEQLLSAYGIDVSLPAKRIALRATDRWVDTGLERHQHGEEPAVMPDDEFWTLIRSAGLWDPIFPSHEYYDHALILGGSLAPQRRRLDALVEAWRWGVRFADVTNLAGDRPLTPTEAAEVRTMTDKLDPEYEWDMMSALWATTDLPAGMRALPMATTHAFRSTGFRAHTGDTVQAWLTGHPTPGRVLLVTIQPHLHQHAQVAAMLPNGFTLETIAASADRGPKRRIYFLGAIARWLKFTIDLEGQSVSTQAPLDRG